MGGWGQSLWITRHSNARDVVVAKYGNPALLEGGVRVRVRVAGASNPHV